MLKGGYFHQACADLDNKTSAVLRELMLVLSHLFGRRNCRQVDDPEEVEIIKRSSSIVYLPPMPEKATSILRKHNQMTLNIFTTYVKTFAAKHLKEEENCLPLTRTQIGSAQYDRSINGHATSNGATNGSAIS